MHIHDKEGQDRCRHQRPNSRQGNNRIIFVGRGGRRCISVTASLVSCRHGRADGGDEDENGECGLSHIHGETQRKLQRVMSDFVRPSPACFSLCLSRCLALENWCLFMAFYGSRSVAIFGMLFEHCSFEVAMMTRLWSDFVVVGG
ncbi:hypothetical protein Salat_2857500 [Sesamum alatum]|uniref:Uncharacterized protein n=1 Tax=Sesamum alatum TaxID=300844 RepID=A0AAE1XM08_9LAMI|nr:hypothetical protein Salat_2857500 [Sesamum alatum]